MTPDIQQNRLVIFVVCIKYGKQNTELSCLITVLNVVNKTHNIDCFAFRFFFGAFFLGAFFFGAFIFGAFFLGAFVPWRLRSLALTFLTPCTPSPATFLRALAHFFLLRALAAFSVFLRFLMYSGTAFCGSSALNHSVQSSTLAWLYAFPPGSRIAHFLYLTSSVSSLVSPSWLSPCVCSPCANTAYVIVSNPVMFSSAVL